MNKKENKKKKNPVKTGKDAIDSLFEEFEKEGVLRNDSFSLTKLYETIVAMQKDIQAIKENLCKKQDCNGPKVIND